MTTRPDNTFSILLLGDTDRSKDGARLGKIRVGRFEERFAVYPFAGSAEDVTMPWADELRALLAGADAVGLPTAINLTWVFYRRGSDLRVQQMLMMPGVGPTLTTAARVVGIPPYRTVNEDGDPLSEWATTVDAIKAFIDTSAAAPSPGR